MGYSARYIIPRFVKYAGKPHGKEPDGKNGRMRERFPDGYGCSLFYSSIVHPAGNALVVGIQSYGRHFPLAHLVLDKAGRRKLWVLNGDHWPGGGFGRTNEHNEMAREAAQNSGTPWVIVPFSALRAAVIDPDTIRVVDVAVERFLLEEHTAAALSQVPEHLRKRPVWRRGDGTELIPPRDSDGSEAWLEDNGAWYVGRHSALGGWQKIAVPGPDCGNLTALRRESEELERQPDGLFHWWDQRHQLGESLFSAGYDTRDRDGWWVKRRALFLSAFDTNEPSPLYFLAQMPAGARPRTIAEARDALKPAEVRACEKYGVPVQRQGDVFAFESGLSTRHLPGPSLRSERVLGVNHRATEVRLFNGNTYARGRLRHDPRGRAEHVTIVLGDGKTWYQLVRNTVPHSYGIPRAWAISGQVD